MIATDTNLSKLIKIVKPFTFKGKRGPDALRDVLVRHTLDATTVTATDLEMVATVTVPAMSEPGEQLFDVSTCQPATDSAGPQEFPNVEGLDGAIVGTITIDFADIKRIADHLVPATDDESSRYALGGVLLERAPEGQLYAVATDARRMHVGRFEATIEGELIANTIVPAKLFTAFVAAAKALGGKAGPVSVTITSRHIRLAWGCLTTTSRLVEGRFPRWRDCIPAARDHDPGERDRTATLDAKGLVRMMREVVRESRIEEKAASARYAAAEKAKGRKAKPGEYEHPRGCTFTDGRFEARGCEMARATAWAGEVILDPVFVADAVAAAAAFGDTVTATTRGKLRAVTITSGPAFTAVLMPMAE